MSLAFHRSRLGATAVRKRAVQRRRALVYKQAFRGAECGEATLKLDRRLPISEDVGETKECRGVDVIRVPPAPHACIREFVVSVDAARVGSAHEVIEAGSFATFINQPRTKNDFR